MTMKQTDGCLGVTAVVRGDTHIDKGEKAQGNATISIRRPIVRLHRSPPTPPSPSAGDPFSPVGLGFHAIIPLSSTVRRRWQTDENQLFLFCFCNTSNVVLIKV